MQAFLSKHYLLHPLAEGVFAAIASETGAAVANAGLVELGKEVIVFDTFMTPQAALDPRRAAEGLFGRAPNLVINSHYHNDHIWGNQVFADAARIVSSVRTRELIATEGKEEFDYYLANSAQMLEIRRSEYRDAEERQRADLAFFVAYYEGLVEAFPNLHVIMPDLMFDRRIELYSGGREVELLTFENAHTRSDTVLYFPQDGVVFMSDLLFVGCHPYLADGDPQQLLKTLREIEQPDATRFVPGQSQVGRRDDLVLMIAYVEQCLELARQVRKAGETNEEQIAALKIPNAFQSWRFAKFFPMNMAFLVSRESSIEGDK